MNIKDKFPIYKDNPNLVYLDSAATTLKPESVIKSITNYYTHYSANVHRGLYSIAEQATEEFENARVRIAYFINAEPEEIVFVKNATEAINTVAKCFVECNTRYSNNILTTILEHHSNLLPWIELTRRNKSKLYTAPMLPNGRVDLHYLYNNIQNVGFAAVTMVSNVTGEILPIAEIIAKAHKQNIPVLIDAAQGAAHLPLDVKKLDADFVCFSGHKMYGPTGIGILYINKKFFDFSPLFYGGNMVKTVDANLNPLLNDMPYKLEAGTSPIAEAIGLGAAVDFLSEYGMQKINTNDALLANYALNKLNDVPELNVIGPLDPNNRLPIFSFTIKGIHAHDIASLLNESNVAVRAGHMCAAPAVRALGADAVVRVSLGIYNTEEDADFLCKKLKQIIKRFK